MLVVVDTGPLYAVVDADDADHEACLTYFQDSQLRLIIPTMVVAEATYLVGSRLGPELEADFLQGLCEFDVVGPGPDDWARISELARQYADFPLGGTDSAVIALAESLDVRTVLTLDRRHFNAVRPAHVPAFELVP